MVITIDLYAAGLEESLLRRRPEPSSTGGTILSLRGERSRGQRNWMPRHERRWAISLRLPENFIEVSNLGVC